MIEVAEAEALILERMPRWPAETVAVNDAVGRVLAETVRAERDQPPFDRVTMDGIAIAYADWATGLRRFRVIGTQAAGAPAMRLAAGECVRIMTGALCPAGADAVIPVERLEISASEAAVADDAVVTLRQFLHAQGSDGRAGDALLAPGARLGPAEIAVLASAGKARVAVTKFARVAAVSTGDELVGPDDPIAPFQIRSCNDVAIEASLRGANLAEVTRARLKDDPDQLLAAIRQLHEANDVLILSGGVSMGDFDFVPAVLKSLGASIVFHRINQKPGRPMWFGVSRDGKPIFALPGNPVSTLACLTRYVLPAMRHAAGLAPTAPEWVQLADGVSAPKGMTYFLPVALRWSTNGIELAEPRPTNTSGDFVSLAGTDGFVELGHDRAYRTGDAARLFRW
jgi:molybdopterin molybdotransferase